MFKRISDTAGEAITFEFEDETIFAWPGDTVAAALLAAGVIQFRETPEQGLGRGPFCMMGVCFDCLLVIDGQPNRQACQIIVGAGMKVRRQKGAAGIRPDGGEDA